MRIALGVEYDGTGFKGWQIQPGQRTVQACLENAVTSVADEPVSVVAAGRTDTGVHASGQIVHFDSDSFRNEHQWVQGINRNLPGDVSVLWARSVGDDFNARFCAIDRAYRYIILDQKHPSALFNRKVTREYRRLDVEAMREAGKALLGEHDFSSFRAAGCQAKTAIRHVYRLHIGCFDNWIWFDIVANAFLQHMVRNIVGALTMVGVGEKPVDWIEDVLILCDRTQSGVTSPADGLYLSSVRYPNRFGLPAASKPVRFW